MNTASNGLKQLSPDNWSLIDPAWDLTYIGGPQADNPRQWVEDIMRVELGANIPENLRTLFEVTCGILVYSLLYYPLLAVAEQQLYRVLDAAIETRCFGLNCPANVQTFAKRIDWLVQEGIIKPERKQQWTHSRILRNMASHATCQPILPPGWALSTLDTAALAINELFSERR